MNQLIVLQVKKDEVGKVTLFCGLNVQECLVFAFSNKVSSRKE